MVVRHHFIVSREHPWLYAYLLERFEGDPNVTVILDRRLADRRIVSSTVPIPRERRITDRRRPVPPEDDLHVRSHYIVEL